MYDFSLVTICLMAFTAVFVLLTTLAIIMRLIMVLFPFTEEERKAARKVSSVRPSSAATIDEPLIAAIATAAAAAFPGTKISKIEEIK